MMHLREPCGTGVKCLFAGESSTRVLLGWDGRGRGTSKEMLCMETAPEKRLQVTIYMEAKLMTYWYKPWVFWGYQCFVDSFEGASLIPERLYLCMYVFIIYLFISCGGVAEGWRREKTGEGIWENMVSSSLVGKKNYFVAWILGVVGCAFLPSFF